MMWRMEEGKGIDSTAEEGQIGNFRFSECSNAKKQGKIEKKIYDKSD